MLRPSRRSPADTRGSVGGQLVATDLPLSLLADEPITSRAGDSFHRSALAERIADLIVGASRHENSTVFAVVGPWGSGKSSLLNMSRECLIGSGIEVVEFNPWLVGGVEALLGEFFNALLDHMPKGKRGKLLRRTVKTYASAAVPLLTLAPVPGAGVAVGLASSVAALGSTGLGSLRKQAEDELRKSDRTYLVVVDDIDRLQPDELLSLLKVVRLLGRLPKVHYLLAFDQESVLNALASSPMVTDRERALAFLEKIVQLRIDLPPLHHTEIAALTTQAFEAALAHSHLTMSNDERRRFARLHTDLLSDGLDQPRKIQRLFAQLYHSLPLVHGEVDVVDLVLLSYVRTTWPTLYGRLPALGPILTDSLGAAVARKTTEAETLQQRWRELIDSAGVGAKQTDDVLKVMCEIFPAVAADFGKPAANSDVLRIGRHVGAPEYFDRYFQLGIPPDDVSDTLIANAMRAFGDDGVRVETDTWLAGQLARRPSLVLTKMRAAWKLQPGDAQKLAPFLVDNLQALEDGSGDQFMSMYAAELWTSELVVSLPAHERVSAVSDLLRRPRGLHTLIRGTEYLSKDDTAPSAEAMADLVRHLVPPVQDRLRQATSEPLTSDELPWILIRLGRLGQNELVRNWLDDILDVTEWTTLDFAACFVGITMSGGKPSLTPLAASALAEILPLPHVVQRLAAELDVASPTSTSTDNSDVSIENRRTWALAALKGLHADRLNEVPTTDSRITVDLDPNRYAPTPITSRADLLFRAAVMVPVDDSAHLDPGQTLESFLEQHLGTSTFTAWLARLCEKWNFAITTWEISGESNATFVRANFQPADVTSTLTAQATLQTPSSPSVFVGDPPAVRITLDVALMLLKRDPVYDEDAQGSTLELDHVLTIAELVDILAEVINGTDQVAKAIAAGKAGGEAAAWLVLTGADAEAVVKLDGITRRAGSSTSQNCAKATSWPLTSSLWEITPGRVFARQTIAAWLRDSGYRGFAQELLRDPD